MTTIFNILGPLIVLIITTVTMALNIHYSSKLKELKTDVTMYESMVEGLILTNREQHNMLLECMEGDKK